MKLFSRFTSPPIFVQNSLPNSSVGLIAKLAQVLSEIPRRAATYSLARPSLDAIVSNKSSERTRHSKSR